MCKLKQTVKQSDGKRRGLDDVPTAALLRLVMTINAATTKMLRLQARMFAMLAREPLVATKGMPQVGLMPTGAVAGFEETLWRTEGWWCWIWR